MICGAWGGRPDKDGLEAVTNASQNLSNMPVEVMEAEHPVRVEDYAFVPDSCGAGQYRGGVGVRRSYRILAPEALLQLRTDRVTFQPYGLNGGEPGGSSRNFIEIGNERNALPGKITTTVARDTLIIHEQAGAGGFGNPLLREPEQVREDFLDGKINLWQMAEPITNNYLPGLQGRAVVLHVQIPDECEQCICLLVASEYLPHAVPYSSAVNTCQLRTAAVSAPCRLGKLPSP